MNPLRNLSVLRKLVQLAAFGVLVYGAPLTGYYLADKLSIAFPVLTCAYDMSNADIGVLIPLQHGMAHRLGETVAAGGSLWLQGLLPVLTTLGTFLLLFVLLNKAFCGWVCPLGFFQEAVHLVGQKLGLRPRESLAEGTVRRLRPAKWLILMGLVFLLPLLTGLGAASHAYVDPYCQICPSRLVTTLANGSTEQVFLDTSGPTRLVLSGAANFLFGLILAVGLTVRQPFCRICPMLGLHAAFRKLGLLRLVKQPRPRCDKCGLCARACPMDIREVHTTTKSGDITFPDCTLCGRCVEFCPDRDVLQLKYAGIRVFGAAPGYFKGRNQAQRRWLGRNLAGWWRRLRPGEGRA